MTPEEFLKRFPLCVKDFKEMHNRAQSDLELATEMVEGFKGLGYSEDSMIVSCEAFEQMFKDIGTFNEQQKGSGKEAEEVPQGGFLN